MIPPGVRVTFPSMVPEEAAPIEEHKDDPKDDTRPFPIPTR